MGYDIIQDKSIDVLISIVNRMLVGGWSLHGRPFKEGGIWYQCIVTEDYLANNGRKGPN